jgi:peptidyl-prolyl cis-trans isomerase D
LQPLPQAEFLISVPLAKLRIRVVRKVTEILDVKQVSEPQLLEQIGLIYDGFNMLQVFRRHSYSWGTRILLLLLGGVFALFFGSWGAASYFTHVRPAAQVGCYSYLHLFTMPGCQAITPEQIDSTTVDLRREIQNMYGEQSQQMLQMVNLRQMALEQLIDQTLINREAAHLGLSISDDELAHTISLQSAFQVDGRFNVQKYNEVLRQNNLEPTVFESKTRGRILSDTIRQTVVQAVQ